MNVKNFNFKARLRDRLDIRKNIYIIMLRNNKSLEILKTDKNEFEFNKKKFKFNVNDIFLYDNKRFVIFSENKPLALTINNTKDLAKEITELENNALISNLIKNMHKYENERDITFYISILILILLVIVLYLNINLNMFIEKIEPALTKIISQL